MKEQNFKSNKMLFEWQLDRIIRETLNGDNNGLSKSNVLIAFERAFNHTCFARDIDVTTKTQGVYSHGNIVNERIGTYCNKCGNVICKCVK
jgi:hypothetical protein